MTPSVSQPKIPSAVHRINFMYVFLILVMGIFIIRAFYVQVIRYDFYHKAALSDQLKQYQIPAERGIIKAYEGNTVVPIVLNQKLYTVYADPTFIKAKDLDRDAMYTASVLGGKADKYKAAMQTKGTEYVVIARKVPEKKKTELLAKKYPGIGAIALDYRTYPQGALAAQLLGFVDNESKGQYGVEQALNKELTGTPGEVKALTDASGVPLVASGNNVQIQPQNGKDVVLTVDIGMQKQMEQILSQEYANTHSQGLSAIVMDSNSGQVKAMANYPSYNPANYQNVSDPNLFQNAAVSNSIEPGSTMKTLTAAAALDVGVVSPTTTFYDPAHWLVDGFNITDIEEDGGARTQSLESILNLSLNTGATWLLMQMGGGKIDSKARNTWYDYMTNHYQLGKPTGIEQGYEADPLVPKPQDNGAGIDLTYANTSFGQGVQVTTLQMAAAVSSIVNGGTYYQPTLVSQTIDSNGAVSANKPKVIKSDVVSSTVSNEMLPLLEGVVQKHYEAGFKYLNFSSNYIVGGKTGTAQVAKPSGGYYENVFNGTYVGFVGGDKPQYVIVVFNIKPNVQGYAGAMGGQPVFADLAHMLINDGYVTPKD
ncbi:MAG TPA: penicillin-binding protein 2 [Candidatus Saccharimonadales bacterium]|nr:penicillin-binding protein 2 [Candidatus Saccharimonadales bacterium]